jgi:uncharacterized protein YqjF (DUF2071 family)
LLGLRQTYLSVAGTPDYDYFFDFDANGVVNVLDLLPFRIRYLDTIPFSFSSLRSAVKSGGKVAPVRQTSQPKRAVLLSR